MDLVNQLISLLPLSYPFELVEVEKSEEKQEVHFYLQISKGYLPSQDHTIHSYYERSWEHLKLFQYRSFLHCRLPIYRHKKTGGFSKTSLDFARDHSRFTLLYEKEVMRLMHIHYCMSSVARQLGIAVQRVEKIYHYYSAHLQALPVTEVATQVGIDETSTRKGHDYITTFVNMETATIIDIEDGKAARAVENFFHNHPNPEAVRQLSMDMSPAFVSGAKRFFAQASITFDKWHVIKLLYKHLDELADKADPFKAYISGLMEDLTAFFQANDAHKGKAQLCFIADFAQDCLGRNPITTTIERHFDGIVNYFDTHLTNGLLEGINSKIQTLKRIARGFRYKENFKKMIRFAFDKNPLSSKIT
jgi:transposase